MIQMEFKTFADHASSVEELSGNDETASRVAELFQDAAEDDAALSIEGGESTLSIATRFIQGRVFPAWDEQKVGVGPNMCYSALARAASEDLDTDDIEDKLAEMGEIGTVAESLSYGSQTGLSAFGGGEESNLGIKDVYESLEEISSTEGSGSQGTRDNILFGVLNDMSPQESKFISRILLDEMRIGVGEGTVRDAISEAFSVPVESVERALQLSNDYGGVARIAAHDGISGLNEVDLSIGRPVQAMLAQAGTIDGAFDEWGDVVCEAKYDGARVQVHYDGTDVELYSRNMESVTASLPDVVEFIEQAVDVPVILDGEVIAIDDNGDPLPFQQILRRFRRKHNVQQMRDEVQVKFRAFDCLHIAGDDLIKTPLTQRHERLRKAIPEENVSKMILTEDKREAEEFRRKTLDDGHEGVMLKNPNAVYSPGKRGKNWLKRKPDVDTLDLAVTGAEWGEGERSEWMGTFYLGCRDDNDEFRHVGKVATGLTEQELGLLTSRLEPHIYSEKGQRIELKPTEVLEVGFDEIQVSPDYNSGYSLRFPRVESIREDKPPADTDTLERVENLYEIQSE